MIFRRGLYENFDGFDNPVKQKENKIMLCFVKVDWIFALLKIICDIYGTYQSNDKRFYFQCEKCLHIRSMPSYKKA